MADRLTADQRRLNMSRIKSRDTKPELTVRSMLHRRGFRFRLHRRDLPGRPDIVLPKCRAAVLVHGCFWHRHDCPLFVMPATRTEFWSQKLESNRQRDRSQRAALEHAGWRTLVIWECALKGAGRLNENDLANQITGFLSSTESRADIAGLSACAAP